VPPTTTTTTTVPSNINTVTVSEENKDVIIDANKETVVNIPSTINNATLDVGALIINGDFSSIANLPEILISAITSISNDPVLVNIPSGSQIEGPAG
jgi:hypothetical protein